MSNFRLFRFQKLSKDIFLIGLDSSDKNINLNDHIFINSPKNASDLCYKALFLTADSLQLNVLSS